MVERACKNCRFIHEGHTCPKCSSGESVDSFKGRVNVLKPEESEVAKNLKIKEKGHYAIKVR
jgi:RNA polymerase subunit RPABC4/transcription elongation factor Spt4